jgi:hypothetical protein
MVSGVESMVHRGVCLGNELCAICDLLALFCVIAELDGAVHLVSVLIVSVTSAGVRALPRQIPSIRPSRLLAAEMGTTSEMLSRTLAKFRDQKLLRVKGNSVVVTRPRELQKLPQRHLGES